MQKKMEYDAEIPVDQIIRGENIRDEKEGIDDLKDSIENQGLLQPIVVSKTDDGKYELADGARRLLCFELLGYKTIPAVYKKMTESERKSIQLMANVQRKSLSMVEESAAIADIQKKTGTNMTDLGKLLNLSYFHIRSRLYYHQVREHLKTKCEIRSSLLSSLTYEMAYQMGSYDKKYWLKMGANLLGDRRWKKEDITEICEDISHGIAPGSRKKKPKAPVPKNDFGPDPGVTQDNPVIKKVKPFGISVSLDKHFIRLHIDSDLSDGDREEIVSILREIGGYMM